MNCNGANACDAATVTRTEKVHALKRKVQQLDQQLKEMEAEYWLYRDYEKEDVMEEKLNIAKLTMEMCILDNELSEMLKCHAEVRAVDVADRDLQKEKKLNIEIASKKHEKVVKEEALTIAIGKKEAAEKAAAEKAAADAQRNLDVARSKLVLAIENDDEKEIERCNNTRLAAKRARDDAIESAKKKACGKINMDYSDTVVMTRQELNTGGNTLLNVDGGDTIDDKDLRPAKRIIMEKWKTLKALWAQSIWAGKDSLSDLRNFHITCGGCTYTVTMEFPFKATGRKKEDKINSIAAQLQSAFESDPDKFTTIILVLLTSQKLFPHFSEVDA